MLYVLIVLGESLGREQPMANKTAQPSPLHNGHPCIFVMDTPAATCASKCEVDTLEDRWKEGKC